VSVYDGTTLAVLGLLVLGPSTVEEIAERLGVEVDAAGRSLSTLIAAERVVLVGAASRRYALIVR